MCSIINFFAMTSVGIVSALKGVYYTASYYEGEQMVNGKPVLVTSPIVYKGTAVPIHAGNVDRGLFKIQQEFPRIIAASLVAAGVSQSLPPIRALPATARLPLQLTVLMSATHFYGLYRGNQPINSNSR